MMRTKPKVLNYISAFLVLTAISFPVQIMVLYNHGLSEVDAILSKISLLNFLVMGFSVLAAVSIHRAHSITKIFTPVLLILVGINNGFVSAVSDDYSVSLTYFATLAFFIAHLPLLNSEIKTIFVNPRQRWWQTPPRKRMEIPMMLSPYSHQTVFRSKTFDLSESGAFVPFSKTLDPLSEMKINDSMFLCLNLGALTQLRCQAKVVRIDESRGDYPASRVVRYINRISLHWCKKVPGTFSKLSAVFAVKS